MLARWSQMIAAATRASSQRISGWSGRWSRYTASGNDRGRRNARERDVAAQLQHHDPDHQRDYECQRRQAPASPPRRSPRPSRRGSGRTRRRRDPTIAATPQASAKSCEVGRPAARRPAPAPPPWRCPPGRPESRTSSPASDRRWWRRDSCCRARAGRCRGRRDPRGSWSGSLRRSTRRRARARRRSPLRAPAGELESERRPGERPDLAKAVRQVALVGLRHVAWPIAHDRERRRCGADLGGVQQLHLLTRLLREARCAPAGMPAPGSPPPWGPAAPAPGRPRG